MLIERKLKLVKPLLARQVEYHGPDSEKTKRVFVKTLSQDKGHLVRANLERWNWAFLEARDSLGLRDLNTQAITVAASFYVAPRSISLLGIKGEDFEAILENTVISQRFTLASTPPPHTRHAHKHMRCPDEYDFDAMLAYIGEYLGISESKNDTQYGTFIIQNDKKNIQTGVV
jgi:hypothetical protein